jgi:hypothetical protein
VLQIHLQPRPHELLKRALLSLAFIFWSASQITPAAGWAPLANGLNGARTAGQDHERSLTNQARTLKLLD